MRAVSGSVDEPQLRAEVIIVGNDRNHNMEIIFVIDLLSPSCYGQVDRYGPVSRVLEQKIVLREM